jgi:CRP-like cAMP-binding protein/Fe-S-cluster-containing hydrogenase component 2
MPIPAESSRQIGPPDDLIIGEMTCLNHYPRSATVLAVEPGEVLEIGRNVLYMLQRDKVARDILDRAYRQRALRSQLQNIGLFKSLSPSQRADCIEFLRDRVELLQVGPGRVIFRQGDPADHMYLVRLGFVKIAQTYRGEERVLDYLGPGANFGEIGLLSKISDRIASRYPTGLLSGIRTATCSALDDAELVRIRGEHFRQVLERFPELSDSIVQQVLLMLENDEASRQRLGGRLDEFLDQGLFDAQKLLVLDLESCTRCDECTKACADSHDGVTRLIREGLRFERFLVASSCRSCLDPYCLVGCPVDAIHRRAPDKNAPQSLEIVIEDWCIGCGQCAKNCPYGNINMHAIETMQPDPERPERMRPVVHHKAATCDLCRDIVGPDGDVSCVYACPHNAAFRMSGPELLQLVDHGRT